MPRTWNKRGRAALNAAKDMWTRRTGEIGAAFRGIGARISEKLFTTYELPVIVLPTGAAPDEYWIAIDFDHVIDELWAGVLIKPQIQIWAGRPDLDRGILARRVSQAFTEQFEAAKKRRASKRKPHHTKQQLDAEVEASAKDVQRQAGTATAAIIAALLASSPVVNLGFLLLAVYKGRDTFVGLFDYLNIRRRSSRSRDSHEQTTRELNKRLDEKRKQAQRAIADLDIQIHEYLHELVTIACDVEGCPSPDTTCTPASELGLPRRILKQYRAQLDEVMAAIIDSTDDTKTFFRD